MLRIVAGFEEPSVGKVVIGGKDVTHLKPNQRNIGMVFQAYALFPNMTVAQNIGFGLRVAGKPSAEIRSRVAEMLELIKLQQLGDRYPYQLSGGQQQRVALARAMAPRPQVLLLDEPLSALDAKVRVSLREEIRAIQKELGITTVFVTHDQEEALSMSDRIVVMYNGRAEQVGTPFEIYNHPATRFVAGFVGTLNVVEGRVVDPESGRISISGGEISVGNRVAGRQAGDAVSLALRPEAIALGRREGRDGLVTRAHRRGWRAVVARHVQQPRQPAAGGWRTGRDQLLVLGHADPRPVGPGIGRPRAFCTRRVRHRACILAPMRPLSRESSQRSPRGRDFAPCPRRSSPPPSWRPTSRASARRSRPSTAPAPTGSISTSWTGISCPTSPSARR
jgi:putative spermidine/putrescine transport system ATP-binding protein